MGAEDLLVVPDAKCIFSLGFVHHPATEFHGTLLEELVASIFKHLLQVFWLQEILDRLCLALFFSDIIEGDPLAGDRGFALLLHLGLVSIEEVLGGLLEEDIVITLPRAVDIASGERLREAAIEGISETTARLSGLMNTGVSAPGADGFDRRDQSVELGQLVISWLENLLLVSGPLIHDKVEGVSDGEHGAQIREESVLMQSVVDERTFRFAWASKLLSQDRESERNFQGVLHLLLHITHENDPAGRKTSKREAESLLGALDGTHESAVIGDI